MSNKKIILLLCFLFLVASSLPVSSYIKVTDEDKAKDKDKNKKEQTMAGREYFRFWDLQKNTVSNIEFYQTNYGIFGNNVVGSNAGGGWWPRGSQNQYIFGGGIWFGAVKQRPDTNVMKKYVTVSYNPNNGRSWMVPGRIEDGDLRNEEELFRYRTFFSTDFNLGNGEPYNEDHVTNWPIWDTEDNEQLKVDRYVGYYVHDDDARNMDTYPKGPAFISGEDIFSVYKDTDVDQYDGGGNLRRADGYPLRLQYEEIIYSWGFGDYKDFIFQKYKIINFSPDTLYDCWMASVMDIDIALKLNARAGASNDRVTYYFPEDSLDLAVQWTNTDLGERDKGFGYLGLDFLESPAVDSLTGFVRKDKKFYLNNEQLGLKTSFNWPIAEDINDDEPRYNTMASGDKMGDAGPGDRRFMMSTGPFHMRPAQNYGDPDNFIPGDTVNIVVGIILAGASKGKDADGSWDDMAELVRKDKFAQRVYDNNFLAPEPPWRARFREATDEDMLHNGIVVRWDSTSEISRDGVEDGMDFLGYRLYRARRTTLDTFATTFESPSLNYPSGKGPLGWKQIAQWEIPTPFFKSEYRGGDQTELDPFIDRLMIVGPLLKADGNIDTLGLKILRVPWGVFFTDDSTAYANSKAALQLDRNYMIPLLNYIDSSEVTAPWGRFYRQLAVNSGIPFIEILTNDNFPLLVNSFYVSPFDSNNTYRRELLDDVMLGEFRIDPSNPTWNPLLYKKETITIQDTSGLLPYNPDEDTYYLLNTWRTEVVDGSAKKLMDVMKPISWRDALNNRQHTLAALDSIYAYIQAKKAKINFPDFVYDNDKHDVLNEVVLPHMEKITNGRSYYDIGDDNHDGYVDTRDDPAMTEKLLNNVEYHYRLLAYDEGDANQPTPAKLNSSSEALPNQTVVLPKAARVGNNASFEITYVDSSRIGGLYNFAFYPINQQRVDQYFAGHELELEFQPYWFQSQFSIDNENATTNNVYCGLYRNRIKLTDITTGQLLYDGIASYENDEFIYQMFTEDAATYVFSTDAIPDTSYKRQDRTDTLYNTFGMYDNRQKILRSGEYNTGDFMSSFANPNSLNMMNEAYGTLGFRFNFSMQQWGGRYRPDHMSMRPSKEQLDKRDPDFIFDKTPIYAIESDIRIPPFEDVMLTQPVKVPYFPSMTEYGSFNNGPASYRIRFKEGGFEEMTVKWGKNKENQKTFNVPYLEMEVVNDISYLRPSQPGSDDSTVVEYIKEVPFMKLPKDYDRAQQFPTPVLLGTSGGEFEGKVSNDFIGKYNLYSVGWVNSREVKRFQLGNNYAYPSDFDLDVAFTTVGTQGRYYLTAQNGEDVIDFTNVFQASGCYFLLDYANAGRVSAPVSKLRPYYETLDIDNYVFGQDFQAGDEIVLNTFGGALGYPLPGAKVRCKISSHEPEEEKYTDGMMNDIKIVPNPFYMTSQAQVSPYENKIFITKLPKTATIDIYTINGDHIETIKHDEYSSPEPDKVAVEIFDLLTKNGFRVQSQVLVAVITGPNGAQTVQQFTVVVGPFRIQPE
jgi:hypothetical protein